MDHAAEGRAFGDEAGKKLVASVPGESFYPTGGGHNTMRLNFSYCKPEIINEGISRLSTLIKETLVKQNKIYTGV